MSDWNSENHSAVLLNAGAVQRAGNVDMKVYAIQRHSKIGIDQHQAALYPIAELTKGDALAEFDGGGAAVILNMFEIQLLIS